MESKPSKNPWLSVWASPGDTVDAVNRYNPRYNLGIFALIYGMAIVFPLGLHRLEELALEKGRVDEIFASIGLLFVSVIVGLAAISLLAVILNVFSLKWGGARLQHLRAAVALSSIPLSLFILLLLLDLITPGFICHHYWRCLFMWFSPFFIYSFVVLVVGVARVNIWKIWRSALVSIVSLSIFYGVASTGYYEALKYHERMEEKQEGKKSSNVIEEVIQHRETLV